MTAREHAPPGGENAEYTDKKLPQEMQQTDANIKIYRNGGNHDYGKTTMSVQKLSAQMGISLPKA